MKNESNLKKIQIICGGKFLSYVTTPNLGMGSWANTVIAQNRIADYSNLCKHNAEKIYQLENTLENEIIEFKTQIEGINCLEKLFFDNDKSVGILLKKAEMNKEDITLISYGHPLIFKDENEFKKIIKIRKDHDTYTSNFFKGILFINKIFNLKDKYYDILENNKNVLRYKEAFEYVLEKYFEKPMEK